VELVTAEGQRVRVDAETEPELWWGLRGGGGNFGIATALEYRLHPVGPLVLGGPVFWPLDQAPRVLRFLHRFAPEAPDELGITLAMMRAGPLPFLPPDRVGTPVLGLVLVWAGDPDEGERATAPLRRLGAPLAELVRPVPYLALQSMLDGGAPHGRHYYWKSHRLPGLADEVVDLLVGQVEAITSPFSQIGGWAMGGAVSRVDPDATAVGEREVGFDLNLAAGWPPADPDPDRHLAWVRRGWEALRPHSVGVYANFLSDEGAAGVEAAYGRRLRRLTALKDRYDPATSSASTPTSRRPASGPSGTVKPSGPSPARSRPSGRRAGWRRRCGAGDTNSLVAAPVCKVSRVETGPRWCLGSRSSCRPMSRPPSSAGPWPACSRRP
jgi:hypothetical protein